MKTHQTLEAKTDRAKTGIKAAKGIASFAGLYTLLSIPSPAVTPPKTPYGTTMNWAVEMIHSANQAVSLFIENVTSIKPDEHVLGVGIGIATLIGAGLYGRMQRNKLRTFRAQADEINGKNDNDGGPVVNTPQPGR